MLIPAHSSRSDALHLHPITQTYQLRPALTYLDNLEALARRAKREQAANPDDSDVEVSDTELRNETAKAVQVSVKQAAEAGTAAAKPGMGAAGGPFNGRAGAGLFAPMRAMEGEAWRGLKHFHADVTSTPSRTGYLTKRTRLLTVEPVLFLQTPEAEEAFDGLLVREDKEMVKLTSTTKPLEYLKPATAI